MELPFKKMALHAEIPEGERVSPLGSPRVERRLALLSVFISGKK